jgi:hypothetical protein
MQLNRNRAALVDGLIRTHYRLDACIGCRHKRAHTPRPKTDGPSCGGSARRLFYLFRGRRGKR